MSTVRDLVAQLQPHIDPRDGEELVVLTAPDACGELIIVSEAGEVARVVFDERWSGRADVVCKVCGRRTKSIVPEREGRESTQGDGCASAYREHEGRQYVCCYYGSGLDCDLYEFAAPALDWLKVDPICDSCVVVLSKLGVLRKVPGEYPFGPGGLSGDGSFERPLGGGS